MARNLSDEQAEQLARDAFHEVCPDNWLRRDEQRRIALKASSPIRAKVDQADMADTPLFGQGSLL